MANKTIAHKVWKISDGKRAYQWSDWQDKGAIAIGWVYEGKIEDLDDFKSIEKLRDVAKSVGEPKPGYVSKQLWCFSKEVKVGDLVVAYASGHCFSCDPRDIIETVGPERVFPIHTEEPEYFKKIVKKGRIVVPIKGKEFNL